MLLEFKTKNYEVLLVTGKNNYDDISEVELPKNVKIVPYIENMGEVLKFTDLIITRAGATILAEITALGIPSIIIPSPYVANNHQYYNALDLVNMKVAEIIEEKKLDANLIQVTINELINTPKYAEMKRNLEKLNTKEASTIIYDEIKELLKWMNMEKY